MYKSHLDDPLSFQDGGSLLYRIGALFSDWLPWSEVPLSCLLLTGDQRGFGLAASACRGF